MTTWLNSYLIYVLVVVAPGGLTSQLSIHTSLPACEAAREQYTKPEVEGILDPLRVECHERVRARYQ